MLSPHATRPLHGPNDDPTPEALLTPPIFDPANPGPVPATRIAAGDNTLSGERTRMAGYAWGEWAGNPHTCSEENLSRSHSLPHT